MSNSISYAASGAKFVTFENTDLFVINRDGSVWLSAADLSRALGYSRSDAVAKVYDRNSHEFAGDMTQVITLHANEINKTPKLGVTPAHGKTVRVFSSRGCHLLAMLSRTEKAGMFRRWVLDVLENLNQKPALQQPITNGQARFIRENFREEVFTKAYDLVLNTDLSENQRIINDLVEKRVNQRLEDMGNHRHSGLRILLEADEQGDFVTEHLMQGDHVLRNSQIADHVLSDKGPRGRDLHKIMQAVMARMQEIYDLPLAGFDELGDL